MSRIGRWPRKNTDARRMLRARLAEAERLAASDELRWGEYREPGRPVQIFPCGDWRDKVIVSDTFAELQAEEGEPEIEPTI